MLSQIRVYFIAVTVIIFFLVVIRTFSNRIWELDIKSSSPRPLSDSTTANKTDNHQHLNLEELRESDKSYSPRYQKVSKPLKVKTSLYFQDENKSDISYFFPLFKDFMGKNLAFQTDNQNPYLKEEQYNFYQSLILNGGLNITQMAIQNYQTNASYEMQKLISQPLDTVKDLGDEMESEFILLNSSNRVYYVGDTVAVRVDVFSTYKVPSYVGGDEVRVWIKDQSKGSSMAVDVEDLGNGSYVARLPLLLPGNLSIFASLTYPNEILKSIFLIRAIMGAIRLNAGGFISRAASEATMCSPFPIDYHGNGLCNLTKANFGRPWFCGRPRNPGLSCENWNETRDMEFPYPLPVGKAQQDWFDLISMGKKHYLRALRESAIHLRVLRRKETKPHLPTKPSCGKRSPRDTWTEHAPRGMFYRMSWVPFGCRLKRRSVHALKEVLKHHTIHLIGDSNLLSWVDIFDKNKLCHIIRNPIDKTTGRIKMWHDPTDCHNIKYNLTIRWRTHGLPFHSNSDHWTSRVNLQSVATTLDQLPVADKMVVVVHLFMHFSTQHYTVFMDRIQATRDAIKRLIQRNPSVKVFIRGPHVAYKEWPASMGGDAQGPLFLQIIRDEFQDLYDKVYLMDFWDMTVAGENQEFHPTVLITTQMIDLFFGYLIDSEPFL